MCWSDGAANHLRALSVCTQYHRAHSVFSGLRQGSLTPGHLLDNLVTGDSGDTILPLSPSSPRIILQYKKGAAMVQHVVEAIRLKGTVHSTLEAYSLSPHHMSRKLY